MASKRPGDVRSLGRAQGARPQASPDARAHEDGERALVGALSVPIEQISPDPEQPRKEFDQDRLDELADSIKAEGVLQPIVVREAGLLDDGRTHYLVVVGGRRYEAARRAGLSRLPVITRHSEGAALRVLQLMENIQREALNPIDEARAFKELMGLAAIDTRAVAARIHRSHTYVADRLKLLAHDDVAAAVARRELTPSAATAVARETDEERRAQLIGRAREGGLRKQDVQRARRERARVEVDPAVALEPSATLIGGAPTLRQVGREMGATEAEIAWAAGAQRDEPDLSAPEALTLAMTVLGEGDGARRGERETVVAVAPLTEADEIALSLDDLHVVRLLRQTEPPTRGEVRRALQKDLDALDHP